MWVWNVKTDLDGAWWVVAGDIVPMNLYLQGDYYFSSDEIYFFHMGIMKRMKAPIDYKPEEFIEAVTLNSDVAPQLFRKFKSIATLIDSAVEIEDFWSIGVQCREILIELGSLIYFTKMADGDEQPKASNFKKKAELFIQFYLARTENSDYRNIIKKLTEATWEYVCKIIHFNNSAFYEASTCVTLCVSLVGVYENIRHEVFDPVLQYKCKVCKSKRLRIIADKINGNGIVKKWVLQCEGCEEITKVLFKENNNGKTQYIKGIEKYLNCKI